MDVAVVKSEAIFLTGHEDNRICGTLYQPSMAHNSENRMSPPIILMHGGGQTRHSWHGTAQQLARRGYVAITVDARGHGDSQWIKSEHYTFDHYRDDLRQITAQIDERWGNPNRPAILVGASMGGISAMLAQAPDVERDRNDLFSAIILVDITPRMEKLGVERIMSFMAKDMRSGFDDIEQAAEAVATYMPHRKRPKSLDGLRKNLRQKDDGRWYWHWDPAFVDGKFSIVTGRENRLETLYEAVAMIKVPTLLVRGSKSELVTKEAAEEFVELVPHAKYVDVTDAGHMVAGDKNDVFASAVIEFLESELPA